LAYIFAADSIVYLHSCGSKICTIFATEWVIQGR